MKATKLEDERLTFNVQVLEGNLADADARASLFMNTADLHAPTTRQFGSQSNPVSDPCSVSGA